VASGPIATIATHDPLYSGIFIKVLDTI
jgi:hypothetical protein